MSHGRFAAGVTPAQPAAAQIGSFHAGGALMRASGLRPMWVAVPLLLGVAVGGSDSQAQSRAGPAPSLDRQLHALLAKAGFTGRVEQTLPARLGRAVDTRKAELGHLLFFDRILSIHSQPDGAFGNPCSGCHSPSTGMGDTQSIAIGIDTAGIVGPDRAGARNQRRTPTIVNNGFYPNLMWDGRFAALSGDPFDNTKGFRFPQPEGDTRFPPHDPEVTHLLIAQAHIPVTENPEMSGFTGAASFAAGSALTSADVALMSTFSNHQPGSNQARAARRVKGKPAPCGADVPAFDDGHGIAVPFASDNVGEATRAIVERRLNASSAYRTRFAQVYRDVRNGAPIRYAHIAQAIAEFELSLTFTNAPIDRYARGNNDALTPAQKRGAVLFFGSADCVACHAVGGASNEMFSDFRNHRLGVPQVAPVYGYGKGNFLFDGPRCDQDFGGFNSAPEPRDPSLQYTFRTTPLRGVGLQPAFFHNGAYTRLEDAIAHHLNVRESARRYDPVAAGLDPDLTLVRPSNQAPLGHLDKRIAQPRHLSKQEFGDLVAFVRGGLTDPRARPENLCRLVPESLPSGLMVGVYQGCNDRAR